jgi:hypothetical protein
MRRIEMTGRNMFGASLILALMLAPALQAGIERVDLQVLGMT